MFKNVASQKVAVFAWDNAAGSAKTGDAANISAQISIDGAATAATDDANPTELDATDAPGIYLFDMTQAETNGDLVVIYPVSSTSDIVLRPVIIYTNPITPTKAGYIDHAISTVDTVADGIQTDLSNGTDGLGALKTLIDTNKTELDGLQGSDGKCAISVDAQDLSGTLDVNTKTITAAAIANATLNSDIGSTVYATNIIALAVRKVLDELNLDHLMKVAVGNKQDMTEVVDATVLAHLMTKTDGDMDDFDPTTDSLEAIADEGVSAGAIADAVWDEAAADHVAAGSFGSKIRTLVNLISVILSKVL